MIYKMVLLLAAILSTPAQATDYLFIGDSHSVGVFGRVLDAKLRTVAGATVRTAARCSSAPDWFFNGDTTPCGYFDRDVNGVVAKFPHPSHAPTPLLPKLLAVPLAAGEKRVTVVALGSNPTSRASVDRMVDVIRKSGSTCVWIGPPRMRKFGEHKVDQIYTVLKEAFHSSAGDLCALIDSRKFTKYPASGGDGIHYGFPGGPAMATAWAEGVFSEIEKP